MNMPMTEIKTDKILRFSVALPLDGTEPVSFEAPEGSFLSARPSESKPGNVNIWMRCTSEKIVERLILTKQTGEEVNSAAVFMNISGYLKGKKHTSHFFMLEMPSVDGDDVPANPEDAA